MPATTEANLEQLHEKATRWLVRVNYLGRSHSLTIFVTELQPLPHLKCYPWQSTVGDMTRQISMTTRKELIAAIGERYRAAPKADKAKIQDEFTTLTGYHLKHAIRVLNGTTAESPVTTVAPRNRIDDEAVRQALIGLWEAGDRVCGKRLKVMIPLLIHAAEHHGHLFLDAAIKDKLLQMSADWRRLLRATISASLITFLLVHRVS